MNRDRDFDRVLEHWLLDGASQMPDRLFDTVLDRIERVPQRRIARLKLRFERMTPTFFKLAGAAALVVVVAVAGMTLLGRPSDSSVGGTPTSGPTTLTTPAPTAAPTAAPTPSPTSAIEGSWKACPTAAQIVAAGGQPAEAAGNEGCTIVDFHAGVFSEFGAAAEAGPPGTYVVSGDQVKVNRWNGEKFEYGWSVSGDTLTFTEPSSPTGVAPAPWRAIPFQRDGA